jgi:hypothetical protein
VDRGTVLKNLLSAVAVSVAPASLGDWNVILVPSLDDFNAAVKDALGAAAPPLGACRYTTLQGDRCAQMSQTACDQIPGLFTANASC